MPKIASRIVAFLLIPCLLADHAIASALNIPLSPTWERAWPQRIRDEGSMFASQALSPAQAAAMQPTPLSSAEKAILSQEGDQLRKTLNSPRTGPAADVKAPTPPSGDNETFSSAMEARDKVLQELPDAIEMFLRQHPAPTSPKFEQVMTKALRSLLPTFLQSPEALQMKIVHELYAIWGDSTLGKSQKWRALDQYLRDQGILTGVKGEASSEKIFNTVNRSVRDLKPYEPVDVISIFDTHAYRKTFERLLPSLERLIQVASDQHRKLFLVIEDAGSGPTLVKEALQNPTHENLLRDQVQKSSKAAHALFQEMRAGPMKMHQARVIAREEMSNDSDQQYRLGQQAFLDKNPEIGLLFEQVPYECWRNSILANFEKIDAFTSHDHDNEAYNRHLLRYSQLLSKSWAQRDELLAELVQETAAKDPNAIFVILRGAAHTGLAQRLTPGNFRMLTAQAMGMSPEISEPAEWIAQRFLAEDRTPLSKAEEDYLGLEWDHAKVYVRVQRTLPAIEFLEKEYELIARGMLPLIGDHNLSELKQLFPSQRPSIMLSPAPSPDAPTKSTLMSDNSIAITKKLLGFFKWRHPPDWVVDVVGVNFVVWWNEFLPSLQGDTFVTDEHTTRHTDPVLIDQELAWRRFGHSIMYFAMGAANLSVVIHAFLNAPSASLSFGFIHGALFLASPFLGHAISHVAFDNLTLILRFFEYAAHGMGNLWNLPSWQNLQFGGSTLMTNVDEESESGRANPPARQLGSFENSEPSDAQPQLTPDDQEIIQLLARGFSYDDIAMQLGVDRERVVEGIGIIRQTYGIKDSIILGIFRLGLVENAAPQLLTPEFLRRIASLKMRQREIVASLVLGAKSPYEIALAMGLSPRSVENYAGDISKALKTSEGNERKDVWSAAGILIATQHLWLTPDVPRTIKGVATRLGQLAAPAASNTGPNPGAFIGGQGTKEMTPDPDGGAVSHGDPKFKFMPPAPTTDDDVSQYRTVVAQRLLATRKKLGLSRADLEARSGVPLYLIYELETNQTGGSLLTWLLLAKGLRIPSIQLLDSNPRKAVSSFGVMSADILTPDHLAGILQGIAGERQWTQRFWADVMGRHEVSIGDLLSHLRSGKWIRLRTFHQLVRALGADLSQVIPLADGPWLTLREFQVFNYYARGWSRDVTGTQLPNLVYPDKPKGISEISVKDSLRRARLHLGLKFVSKQEILIEAYARKMIWVPEKVVNALLGFADDLRQSAPAQHRVLISASTGHYSNKIIASELGKSPATIKEIILILNTKLRDRFGDNFKGFHINFWVAAAILAAPQLNRSA